MPKYLKPLLYGLGVFLVYMVIIFVIGQIMHRASNPNAFLGVYLQKDLLMGVGIAVFLTFMNIKKNGLK